LSELERISGLAKKAVLRYGTRNPFSFADAEGIRVMSCPDFKKLKGMYKIVLGQRFVFLNGNLSRSEAKFVLAHELGHDALHREMAENSIVQDEFILDMTLKPEYEANLFAAEFLFSDEAMRKLLREGLNPQEIAGRLRSNVSLVELKVRTMEKLGRIF